MCSSMLYAQYSASNMDAQVGYFSFSCMVGGDAWTPSSTNIEQESTYIHHSPVLNCLPGILQSVSFGGKFLATEVIANYSTTLTLSTRSQLHEKFTNLQ